MTIDEVKKLIAETVYPIPNSDHADAYKIADAILTALEAKGLVIEQWWRPIETAPKDGTDIILAVPSQQFDGKPTDPRSTVGHWAQDEERKIYLGDCGGECRCPEYDYDEDATWISWDGGFTKENPPTHWRPLPEPPAMISSAEQGEG